MLRARRRNWGRLTVCAVMLLLVVPAAVSARPRKPAKPAPVPPGFVGMVIDGPLYPVTEPPLDMATQLDSMVATGVETMRATFDWSSAQPYQNFSQVPNDELSRFTDIGGVPTDFTQLDQFVGLAAQRRMTILPTVLDAPKWDRDQGHPQPHRPAPVQRRRTRASSRRSSSATGPTAASGG